MAQAINSWTLPHGGPGSIPVGPSRIYGWQSSTVVFCAPSNLVSLSVYFCQWSIIIFHSTYHQHIISHWQHH